MAGLALVGAFGDMQYSDGFRGINQTILAEATESGVVEEQEDLKIASKVEPLYKSLAHTFQPAIPGISGDLEGSQSFLEKIGISYGVKFTDLANEEKDFLKERLVDLNPQISVSYTHLSCIADFLSPRQILKPTACFLFFPQASSISAYFSKFLSAGSSLGTLYTWPNI